MAEIIATALVLAVSGTLALNDYRRAMEHRNRRLSQTNN